MSEQNNTLALVAGIGVLAGMRSMSAPALVSRQIARRRSAAGSGPPDRFLASPRVASALTVLAAGEMVFDKTPWVPRRTKLPSVFGRALWGALSGVLIAGRRGSSRLLGGLVGSAAAVGSTFLSYNLRTEAGRLSNLPDPILGLVEDGIVYTAGSRLAPHIA